MLRASHHNHAVRASGQIHARPERALLAAQPFGTHASIGCVSKLSRRNLLVGGRARRATRAQPVQLQVQRHIRRVEHDDRSRRAVEPEVSLSAAQPLNPTPPLACSGGLGENVNGDSAARRMAVYSMRCTSPLCVSTQACEAFGSGTIGPEAVVSDGPVGSAHTRQYAQVRVAHPLSSQHAPPERRLSLLLASPKDGGSSTLAQLATNYAPILFKFLEQPPAPYRASSLLTVERASGAALDADHGRLRLRKLTPGR